jgi:hypothetical protein
MSFFSTTKICILLVFVLLQTYGEEHHTFESLQKIVVQHIPRTMKHSTEVMSVQ